MNGFDKVNMMYGLIVTALTAVFGKYWFLFAGFLLLNMADYITGYCKARIFKKESSSVGAKGISKKVFYWFVVGIAFFISHCFVHLGELIGADLAFVQLFGWFTLATYLINEIRSILENLVEMNVSIPTFLVKGLNVTQKLLDAKTSTEEREEQ